MPSSLTSLPSFEYFKHIKYYSIYSHILRLQLDLKGQAAIRGHLRKNAHQFFIRSYKVRAPYFATWSCKNKHTAI